MFIDSIFYRSFYLCCEILGLVLKSEKLGLETHYSLYDEGVKEILNAVEKYVNKL